MIFEWGIHVLWTHFCFLIFPPALTMFSGLKQLTYAVGQKIFFLAPVKNHSWFILCLYFSKGYFVEPTIIETTDPEDKIMKEVKKNNYFIIANTKLVCFMKFILTNYELLWFHWFAWICRCLYIRLFKKIGFFP